MKKADTTSHKKKNVSYPRCLTLDNLSAEEWPGTKFDIKLEDGRLAEVKILWPTEALE